MHATPTQPLPEPETDALEQLYKITFTPRERMLLTAGTLLTPVDVQRRYILRMDLTPLRCPGCFGIVCKRSCEPEGLMRESGESVPDDKHVCPLCGAGLRWSLALIGGQQFLDLTGGQTVTIGKGPVQEQPGS